MSDPTLVSVSPATREAFKPILAAVARARADLAENKDVAAVRPGYKYAEGAAPLPALVVAVTPGARPVAAADLEKSYGVPTVVADATVEEQLARLESAAPVSFGAPGAATVSAFEALIAGDVGIAVFGPPKSGSYEPLDPPNLPLVNEAMALTICPSPEAGFTELKKFLGETEKSLTVAMYQFTAPHIFDAVNAAVSPEGREFELVLHPIPERPPSSGVKADDLDETTEVLKPLSQTLENRFEFAWATLVSKAHPDGLWASAYHIKVAVRDGNAVWLSSGNWQSSNQPNVHPFDGGDLPAGFQRKYNRDYHAIVKNDRLASIFEQYIKRDHDLSAAQGGSPTDFAAPDLFVPEAPETPEPFAAPPQFFKPLTLDRVVSVQPLLTPDNYAENALALIRSAKQSVWFQNQYINFRGTDEDFTEFKLLVSALKDQIDKGLDVRIICRDLMKQESLDILVALGFPAETFRFQPACHNKCIIVDNSVVMFGSHNWSNEGVKTNRDASLIFDDKEIAEYLAQIYDYDWNRLATAHPAKSRPRVARPDEATPEGFSRVAFSEVFDD